MIFVSVGTQLPFPRLIRYCQEARESLGLKQEFFFQHLDHSLHLEGGAYSLNHAEYQQRLSRSQLMISHAGIGNLLSCRTEGKPILVVPRSAKLGEHRNDHQFGTCEQMKNLPWVHIATNLNELKTELQKILATKTTGQKLAENELSDFLFEYVSSLSISGDRQA